jgi:hypothetical protein
MRIVKEVLLFSAEVALLICGFAISFQLAVYFDSRENNFAAIAFFGSLFLTALGFFFRRKTRKWKIEQSAARWMAKRSGRQVNSRRAKFLHVFRRSLLWFPSIGAAFVLLLDVLRMRTRVPQQLGHFRSSRSVGISVFHGAERHRLQLACWVRGVPRRTAIFL